LGKIETPKEETIGLFDGNITVLQKDLAETRHSYFTAKTLKTKLKYRDKDKDIREQMLQTLKPTGISPEIEQSMKKVVHWDLYNQNAISDWFDPEWMFGVKNGFDIVIGNPPYIRQERIKQWKDNFKRDYQIFAGKADIYTYFYEKGVNLLSKNGHLCYITSNKWMRAKYGEKLRQFFLKNAGLKQIIDFEGEQIFENATVDTNILLCAKNKTADFNYQKQLPDVNNPLFTMAINDLSDNAYTLQPPEILALKKKIETIGTPLKDWDIKIYRGVLTGFNKAFIIDTATKERLCKVDAKSAEIIKPMLKGRDIKAYEHHWAGLWIVATFPALNLNIDDYPSVKKHLESYGKRIHQIGEKGTRKKTGNKWFETQDQIAYHEEFSKEKIMLSKASKNTVFYLDSGKYFIDVTAYIIVGKNLQYLTALLNSNTLKKIFAMFYSGGGIKGEMTVFALNRLPIPQISTTAQQPFIKLVDKILQAKNNGKDTTALETKIDTMVYQLYDLGITTELIRNKFITHRVLLRK
jgi:hypothetical protein